MAQDGEVSVKLRITAEDGGVSKAEQGLRRVESAAKGTASGSTDALGRMKAGVSGVSSAVESLRKIMTGFGVAGLAVAVTGAVGRIIDSFGAAKKNAREFADIQRKLGEEKAVASLANDYARLTEAIGAAAAAENHQLEMIDLEVANRRKLDAAKLDAAKEDEISKLDANAQDYGEQLAKVEAKYAALRSAQEAGNATEDLVLQRKKMNAQASQKDEQARAQDAATAVIDRQIRTARRERSAAEIEAASPNEDDKTGTFNAIGKTLKQLFTGDWGRMAGATTAEGDAARKQAAEKAAQLELKIQQLEEEKRKSEEKAEAMRNEAERIREKAGKTDGQIEAAEIAGDTARRQAARVERSAQSTLDKNHADQAAEEAKVADAEKARQLLARQKADLQARIAAEQERKDAANHAVYRAQGTYDAASLGGNRRAQQSALGSMQAAQNAAQNVNHAADKAISALTETLRSVETRLKAAQSYLESQSKQQRNAWSEAPAGA